MKQDKVLEYVIVNSPIGRIIAVADNDALHLLEFTNESVDKSLMAIGEKLSMVLVAGKTQITDSIKSELKDYFAGTLTEFKTPIMFRGTAFQKTVWNALQKIPFGQVKTYGQVAMDVSCPRAFRAVGNANGVNRHPIIVPCHRVVAAEGKLGGYSAGLDRKRWLLAHESRYLLQKVVK